MRDHTRAAGIANKATVRDCKMWKFGFLDGGIMETTYQKAWMLRLNLFCGFNVTLELVKHL